MHSYAAGEDFINKTNPDNIALSANISQPIKITIINDRTFELTETFLVNLSPWPDHVPLPPGVTLNQTSVEVTILDNDGESLVPVLNTFFIIMTFS